MTRPAQLWRRAQVFGAGPRADAWVTVGERIEWVGSEASLDPGLRARCSAVHDLGGALVTPALIDCHTHLVFAGNRAAEFAERRGGVSYTEIARRGGGILATVRATRAASLEQLIELALPRAEALLREGVTTIEIKSGYGLTLADEARMLRAARALATRLPIDVRTTYLAAHAVPPEFAGRDDHYVRALALDWLPLLVEEGLVDAVDIYCDEHAFRTSHAETLYAAALEHGLPVRMHAEQFANVGGSQLAARHGALSCDHLEEAGAAEIEALAAAGTVAVLLPVAWYCLGQTRKPPVAALRAHGVPMAVATDCNPGTSPCASLLLAMSMAAQSFGLTPDEVVLGATAHAARALGLGERRGRIAAGFDADLAVWNAQSPDELAWWTGFNSCRAVIRRGAIVRGQP